MNNNNMDRVTQLLAELEPDAPLGTDFMFFSIEGQQRALREAERYLQTVRDFQPARWTKPEEIAFRNALIREFEEKIAGIKQAGEHMEAMSFGSEQEREDVVTRLRDIARRLELAPVKEKKS